MFRAAENWTDEANGTYLQFTTTPIGSANWAERMRIDPGGNVGIGTTAPGQKLSVAGTIESTAGGFRFPDGTTQATASPLTGVTPGSGISITGSPSSPTVSIATGGVVNGMLGSLAVANPNIADVSASKITGSLPVGQVAGAATLGANTFAGTQTISGGNLVLPATTGATIGVLTLGGQSFVHSFGGAMNTFVGGQAGGGWATTGTMNTATGLQALLADTTGNYNSAFGALSLRFNTTGYSNATFGYASLYANTAIGNSAFGTAALKANTAGYFNVGMGWSAGYYNTTGSNNTFLGASAGPDGASGDLSYAAAVGHGARVTQNNSLVLGGVNGTAYAVSVGIGTSAPDTKLQVVGDIKVGTSGTNGCVKRFDGGALTGTCSSDLRLKANVRPFEPVLDRVVRLQPVRFTWRADQFPEYHFGAGLNSGLIAQEVEKLFPELVSTDERGYKMVNYSELPYLTLAAVKELKVKSDRLEAENDALKAQLAALAERLARLEKR